MSLRVRDKNMRPTQMRLEEAENTIRSPSFWRNDRQNNDIGYYLFDYPAEDELVVREWVEYLQRRSNSGSQGFELIVFDLYDIIIEIIENKGYLEHCFRLEEKSGIDRITVAVGRTLKLSGDLGVVVEYIRERMQNEAVILLKGLGKCYPILRAHKIINSLHQMLVNAPVVLLYPGKYEEKQLLLFGSEEEDNYYWVKRLVKN